MIVLPTCRPDADLHTRLVALQDDEELERKAAKSKERANLWTQEELDAADRQAFRLWRAINTPDRETLSELPSNN